MNWEDLSVGVIGSTFGLGPGSLAAVGAARYYQKMRKINPGGNPYKVDFQMPFKRRRVGGKPAGGIANVTEGGIGVYKGDFYKRRQSVVDNSVTQYGFQRESEHFGTVKCPDVQYFGVQNINAVMAARGIAVAYIRMIFWRHFKQTYASEGDLLFELASSGNMPQLYQIVYITGVRDSTGLVSIGRTGSPVISSTTTLNDLVVDLAAKLEGVYGFGLVDYTGAATAQPMLVGYQLVYGQVGALGGPVSPIYYTEDQIIRYSCTTVVQFQNQTVGQNGGTSRVSIDCNPVVGKVFTTKGLYPLVEKQYRSEWDSQLSSNTDIPSFAGVLIPSVAPTGAWRSIPTPQVFSNIIKCESGLRLEAAEIKKDILKFNFRGTMRQLFDGLRINAVSDSGSGNILETDYTSTLGYNKLFAFEKVVPIGTDQVVLAYHLDRYHTCVMGLEYHQHSCRREFAKSLFNRTINPPALLRAPINEVGAVDDVNE